MTVMEDGESKVLRLSLEDILIFATGAAGIPPLGFEQQPSIAFKAVHDGLLSDLPTASTCSNTLYMPTVNHNNCIKFKYNFVFAVSCAVGFGKV